MARARVEALTSCMLLVLLSALSLVFLLLLLSELLFSTLNDTTVYPPLGNVCLNGRSIEQSA